MNEKNAERLTRIKVDFGNIEGPTIKDYKWLIEQAERVRELERNIELLEGQKGIKTALNNEAVRIIEEKERESKRLREEVQSYQMKYENSGSIMSRRNQLDRIERLEEVNERLRGALEEIRVVEPLDHVVINSIARQALEGVDCD